MKSSEIGHMHIEQFNALFERNIIDNVVSKTSALDFKNLRLSFEQIQIHQPLKMTNVVDRRLLPCECREQSLTYGGSMFLKVNLTFNGNVLFSDFKSAGTFPIMLKSNLCHLTGKSEKELFDMNEHYTECGGYFIASGYDRIVRFHVAWKRNHLFAFKSKSKDSTYSDYTVAIRAVGDDEIGQKNEIKYCNDGNIHFKLYLYKRIYLIPVVLLLRALKSTTDEDLYFKLDQDHRILQLLHKISDSECFSQRESLSYLGNRFKHIIKIEDPISCGKEFLKRILVHLDKNEDKFNCIIMGIKKLLKCVDGLIEPDSIDLSSNHELYTEAQLIPLVVKEKLEEIKRIFSRKVLALIRRDSKKLLEDDGEELSTTSNLSTTTSINTTEMAEAFDGELSPNYLTKIKKIFDGLDFNIGLKLRKFLSTGNITTYSCSDLLQMTGFTIMAERINFWRFASHFQSVSRGAFFTTLKITTVRKLRPESFGFLCPIHTPDGSPCGLLLHLTQGCSLTNTCNSLLNCKESLLSPFSNILYEFGINPNMDIVGIPVFYNGKVLGTTSEPAELTEKLRKFRRINDLSVEICYDRGSRIYEAIYIFDQISRLMRPVINLSDNRVELIGMKEQVFLDIQLADFVSKDIYDGNSNSKENMNVQESTCASFRYKYREVDNMNMFSSVAACISFADYNPSPRNMYQCQMAKQAMGLPAYNNHARTDNKSYLINYLQSPTVRTNCYDMFKDYPIGYNCIVAVISYTAYDMEDAVIINKASDERGLFSSYIYKTEKIELGKNDSIVYTPFVGNKINPSSTLVIYKDESGKERLEKYHGTDDCIVDKVRIFTNETGNNVNITLRVNRKANIGDKFCSRHGQKGVCSFLWPEVDMPYTEHGIKPDIIINPHAFPSRMTIGMLLESMCGKSSTILGKECDSTPFQKSVYFEDIKTSEQNNSELTAINVGEELKKCGYNYYGNEPMYSGITGVELKTDIFIGVVYYQRLRHMVNDKFQVRTNGAVVSTTHQPVGGRKHKGGIRFGEMERDAVIAHGTAAVLKDRLMDCSDKHIFTYCCKCRSILFSQGKMVRGGEYSCICKSGQYKLVELPYVFKYLCSELAAMNIKVELDIK